MPSLLEGLFFWRKRSRDRFEKALKYVNSGGSSIHDLGILAEATQWDEESREKAENALIRLLPTLRMWFLDAFTNTQRAPLFRYLNLDTPNPELTLTLLNALENSTEYKALSYVEELAKAKPDSSSQESIVQMARESLPVLRKRITANLSAHTLLTPSHPPPKPPEDTSLLLQPSFPPSVPSSTARPAPKED